MPRSPPGRSSIGGTRRWSSRETITNADGSRTQMNGILTGLFTIGLGAIAFLPAYLDGRKTGKPLVRPDLLSGYIGVTGLAIMCCGVVIILVSVLVLVFT